MPALGQATDSATGYETRADAVLAKSHLAGTVSLWRLGAARGEAHDQYKLGLAYMRGHGVPCDCSEGARWLRRAAERGHEGGQINLGVAYARGIGVPQDAVLAHMWFNLAAAEGSERGRRCRVRISGGMTRDEVADAQRLARDWKPAVPYRL